jgi:hypothetical protein
LDFLPALPFKTLLPSSGSVFFPRWFFIFFPAARRRSGRHDEPPANPAQMPMLQRLLHP